VFLPGDVENGVDEPRIVAVRHLERTVGQLTGGTQSRFHIACEHFKTKVQFVGGAPKAFDQPNPAPS
jgi:hypothetical protein